MLLKAALSRGEWRPVGDAVAVVAYSVEPPRGRIQRGAWGGDVIVRPAHPGHPLRGSFPASLERFLRAAQPESAADRQWQLGVFLYSFEKKPEGRVMQNQAAESKADYQPFLKLFPQS